MIRLACDHSSDCGCHGRAERWREWFDRPRGPVDHLSGFTRFPNEQPADARAA